ncbi:hypothetical protein NC656_09220, partial [Pseudomonas asiatica]|uniref:hypothetical protein n=1 Tax=Pseudomonas asiatica TaxID=2219225 RepID=UPI00209BDF80
RAGLRWFEGGPAHAARFVAPVRSSAARAALDLTGAIPFKPIIQNFRKCSFHCHLISFFYED